MRIDLHTHSDRSDGTDPPAELIGKAAEAGLDVVALTDHDSTEGWAEAAAAARSYGISFVPGLEISCRHAGAGVHLLAYLLDPAHPALVGELTHILAGRDARLPGMVERLQALGIRIDLDDVRAAAGPAAALGRPHVADALVKRGVVNNRDEAFDRYLAAGRPAYVDRYAADLTATVGFVAAAGGVSVIAHPWSRQSRAVLDARTLSALADCGLTGVEVDHGDHDPTAREQLGRIAVDAGLVRTGASDYHGAGKVGHDLGSHTTEPDQYARLLDRARVAAAATGRAAPQTVVP